MALRKQRPPQSIRILGGTLRGRTIAVPSGMDVRPTAARTREALFNLLMHGRFATDGGNILAGARVADLCCGSGALAFEALSRGAAHAVLVDQDRRTLDLAEKNAEHLGVAAQCTPVCATLPARIPHGPFDLVFLDPPYRSGLARPILEKIIDGAALATGAIVCVETETKHRFAPPPPMTVLDERTYGAARILILAV